MGDPPCYLRQVPGPIREDILIINVRSREIMVVLAITMVVLDPALMKTCRSQSLNRLKQKIWKPWQIVRYTGNTN